MDLRMGVIGYGGRISGVIDACIRTLEPGARIAAICDLREAAIRESLGEAAQGIRFYDDPDTMLDRETLDGVLVGTRCNLHTSMALKVMARNLPMYLEKPVAVSWEQVNALHAASKTYTAGCVVSFPLRLSPLVLRAQQLIRDGAIGRLEHMQAVNNVPYGSIYFDDWYRDFKTTQGLFLQKATHDIDYLSVLAGARPKTVAAMMSRARVYGGDKPAGLRCNDCKEYETCPESPFWKYYKLGHGAMANGRCVGVNPKDHECCFGSDIGNAETGCNEDSASCLLEFDSGLQAVYTQNFFARRDAGKRGATLVGYDGTLTFDWYTEKLALIRHHISETVTFDCKSDHGHGGGDIELGYEFIRAMKGATETRSPLRAGIQSVLACLACRSSAEQKKFMEVPRLD